MISPRRSTSKNEKQLQQLIEAIHKDSLGFPKIFNARTIQESYFYRNQIVEFFENGKLAFQIFQFHLNFLTIKITFLLHFI
jgi:hypothetical protein